MNLLFAGDSLIEFFDWQARFPGHTVANFGRAGESVQGLLGRAVKFPDLFPHADMVFLMSGINNLAMEDAGFTDFYRIIVERLRSAYPDARLHVHSLLPVAVDFIDNASIITTNTALRQMASESGATYVDLYKRFVLGNGSLIREYLLDDGVHLSKAGYDVWCLAVEELIRYNYQ